MKTTTWLWLTLLTLLALSGGAAAQSWAEFVELPITESESDSPSIRQQDGDILVGWRFDGTIDGTDGSWLRVAYSDDNGQSWKTVVATPANDISGGAVTDKRQSVDLRNADEWMAAYIHDSANRELKIRRTLDGGDTWEQVHHDASVTMEPNAVEMHHILDDRWMVVFHDGDSGDSFKIAVTTDNGETWSTQSVNAGTSDWVNLNTYQRDNNQLSVVGESGTSAFHAVIDTDGLIRDNGEIFSGTNGDGPPAIFHEDTLVLVGLEASESPRSRWLKSTDHGQTFTQVHEENGRFFTAYASFDGSADEAVMSGKVRGGNGDVRLSLAEPPFTSWETNKTQSVSLTTEDPGEGFNYGNGFIIHEETGSWMFPVAEMKLLASEEAIVTPPGEVGPEPVDFAQGVQDAAAGWGFRTSQSQMFFALAAIGIATVATGTGMKAMSSGRTKNLILAGVGFLVGVFFVLVRMLDFWMLTVATILAGFALLGGPREVANTWTEATEAARRLTQDEAQGVEGEQPPPPGRPEPELPFEGDIVDIREAEDKIEDSPRT